MDARDRRGQNIRLICLFTVGCGLTSLGIGVFSALMPQADTTLLDQLFNTTLYLFAAGVGAILSGHFIR